MDIIKNLDNIKNNFAFNNINKVEKSENIFDNMYNTYIDLYQNTNLLQNNADKVQLDFATGKTEDIISVMMAQEKAYASINFLVQSTNKVVESYKEIMRIQL